MPLSSDRLATAALAVLLLGVALAGWWLEFQPPLRVDASPLASLPDRIDGRRGRPISLESTVESMLRADFNVQRAYRGSGPDDLVWLYVGYYGSRRGGRPEHTPAQCYPSAGWRIEAERDVLLDAARGWRANEYVVSRPGERRLVLFWYRSARDTGMLGGWDVTLDQLRGRVARGRRDGALVRLSTPVVDGGTEAARERLVGFARALEPLLEEHWPREWRPAGGIPSQTSSPGA